ncbi:hypothetical protein GC425_03650 [Corynebacterium sp. zg254]|uniref:Secreted protein n=1 Tax=Corynebacterium zhongnanshanii TaxID=2768834 RepID=A0ABQ6VEZ3_9CORY|nr:MULTISPECIES: hypothetical protein [Corynebacterium]KAB3522955.1 hypothetical protein F8377_01970 [Corynebacterium zhongnanshanii]MCR5913964.1 hypothetical protein [Corynebacterium sp. zg254]
MDQDSRRKKLVWESLLGFLGFFTVVALIQAIWNIFQDDPSIVPSLLLLVLLVATAAVWRRYRRL